MSLRVLPLQFVLFWKGGVSVLRCLFVCDHVILSLIFVESRV